MSLQYVSDETPGFRRIRRGRGFSYVQPDGSALAENQRRRCEALAVPPAWRDVWICPDPSGHIQATGVDEKGRKQYRYHPDFRSVREREKFDALPAFAEALPRLRRAIRRDLKAEPGSQTFALAAALALLDQVPIRIGSTQYAKRNGTVGLTTLKARHIATDADAGRIEFKYRAKGGRRVQRTVQSRRLLRLMHQLEDVPGSAVFSYVDNGGEVRSLSGAMVNDYLKDRAGDDFTAKTFRTWSGSVAAMAAAARLTKENERLTIKALSEAAAARLANTPTIARTSYIHPGIIALAEEEDVTLAIASFQKKMRKIRELRRDESLTLAALA